MPRLLRQRPAAGTEALGRSDAGGTAAVPGNYCVHVVGDGRKHRPEQGSVAALVQQKVVQQKGVADIFLVRRRCQLAFTLAARRSRSVAAFLCHGSFPELPPGPGRFPGELESPLAAASGNTDRVAGSGGGETA